MRQRYWTTLTQTAVMPTGTNSQTTAYVYGTSSTSGVYSNDLLAKTEYPDPSTGLASTSAANDESYTYNALGQKTSYTDRNGTTHAYDDDVLGRLISDVIPTGDLGTGVSNQTLALGYTYNNAGLPFQQTSYSDSAMTTVENQVEDLYNGLGQMIEQYQETSGAVNTGTSASVQWRYSFGSNHSQLAAMTYPNGREEDYGYNAGIDTTISRISTIADDGGSDAGTVAAYTYLGLSTIVQEAEPQINTELTYINQSGDTHALTDGGDRYTGLDRFGRVDDQWYLNTSTSATVDRLQYGYDRDGDVLYQNNLVNAAFSELYHANSTTSGDNNTAYDPLNRLTSFRRGTLTSSGNNGTGLDTITTANLNSTTGVPNQNSWSLDALGNWTSGAGVSNTFNSQNEETGNGSSTLTYDHNGNMTTDQAGNLYTFDAWNQLIRIANSSNSTLEVFQYDAQGRAVVNNNGSGVESRYYDGTNIIQEQFGTTYIQFVRGLAYVNEVILRDRNADGNNSTGNLGITGSGMEEREYEQHDTQFSAISLTDSTGAVIQRYVYDPYGTSTSLNASWAAAGTGTNYWLYTFQGMRIVDAPGISGMLFSQTRIYDANLGRWISQDWRRYIDGTDLYEGYHDNPTDDLDSSGLSASTAPSVGTLIANLSAEQNLIRRQALAALDNMGLQGALNGDYTLLNELAAAYKTADLEGKKNLDCVFQNVRDAALRGIQDVLNSIDDQLNDLRDSSNSLENRADAVNKRLREISNDPNSSIDPATEKEELEQELRTIEQDAANNDIERDSLIGQKDIAPGWMAEIDHSIQAIIDSVNRSSSNGESPQCCNT